MSKGMGTAAVKIISLLGADFKRQFDLDSYKKFLKTRDITKLSIMWLRAALR